MKQCELRSISLFPKLRVEIGGSTDAEIDKMTKQMQEIIPRGPNNVFINYRFDYCTIYS